MTRYLFLSLMLLGGVAWGEEIKVTRDESVRIDFPDDTEIRTSWSAYWKFMVMSSRDAAKLRDALINAIGNAPCDDEKFQKVLDEMGKRKP